MPKPGCTTCGGDEMTMLMKGGLVEMSANVNAVADRAAEQAASAKRITDFATQIVDLAADAGLTYQELSMAVQQVAQTQQRQKVSRITSA